MLSLAILTTKMNQPPKPRTAIHHPEMTRLPDLTRFRRVFRRLAGMLVWLMVTSSTWSLLVFGTVFCFSYGGHAPQLPALIGETLGFENMGATLGAINLFWGIGSAIGPFVTAYMFDVTGSYKVGFTLAAAFIFSASGIGLLLKGSKS